MFTLRASALLILIAAPCAAQGAKAEMRGMVRDPSGRPAPGAALELQNTGTNATLSAGSGEDGSFQFLAVPTGVYRLSVGKQGFAAQVHDGIPLRLGDRLEFNIDLTLGDENQIVEVRGSAPLLETGKGGAGFVTDGRKVVTLPLDGRNFVPLLALAPGVNLPPGGLLPRINGSRPRVSEYIYDGISVLQPEPGQVAFYPIIDAIDEFRVETNSYSAEYGRSNGGVIIVNQKSGTNDLHGTLFEFFRNEKLNARNLFATSGQKARFRRNQYGFVLGGPVRKDRTFAFADWQGARLSTGAVRTSTVPTSAQRRGEFSTPIFDPSSTRRIESGYARDRFANDQIPLDRFDKAALAAMDRYPSPNVRNAEGAETVANNYTRVGHDAANSDQFDGRTDHYMGAAHRMFARYSFLRDQSTPATPLPGGSGNLTSGVIGDTLTRSDSITAEDTWTISPAAVNQLRFGYTRRSFEREALRMGRSAGEVSLIPNIPVTSFHDVLPTFDVVGLQQIGPPSSANSRFGTSVTQFIDTLSWIRGAHSLKAGADIRLQRLDVLQPANPTGNFQFTSVFTAGLAESGAVIAATGNSFASFLLGEVARFSLDAQPEPLKPRATIAEFFVQDDIRATSRLTLNLGVRYTLNVPSTVVNDRGAVFNLRTERLDFTGANGNPRSARSLEKLNFAPRAGLAYKLTGSLVLRAGYGMTWIEQAGITTPFTTPLFPFIQTIGQQSGDNIQSAFQLSKGPSVRPRDPSPDSGLGQGVFAVQRDNGSGYAQQWNLTIQKTVAQDWSFEAGYLGSKLTRLGVPDVNLNQLTVEQLGLGAQLLQQRPNPFYGEIPADSPLGKPTVPFAQLLRPYPRFTTVALYRNNIGHSTYHSAQTRIEKRFSRGLTFTAAYTFSRLIDDAGAVFDSAVLTGPVASFQAADSHNKRLEKDVSTGNVPHIFSSGFVYELPLGKRSLLGGWQVAGIARAQSGSPVAVTQATNLNAFAGFGIQRPNRIADPNLPTDLRSTSRWFDTSVFRAAPQFTIGNTSRNPVRGPAYRTLDAMVGKTFAVGERLRAEFRAEAFNVTNTPPLGNPNGSFGAAAFGTIATAQDPRVFELVLKLHF